jgi:hypothetical protein
VGGWALMLAASQRGVIQQSFRAMIRFLPDGALK